MCRNLRAACWLMVMPALCACFSASMLPGTQACNGLSSRVAPSSLRRRRQAALVLRASLGEGDGANAKEAALRRLASADAPKSAPKKVAQNESPLPEWTFFVLPIFGAACAFAFQVSVCVQASNVCKLAISGYHHMCAGACRYIFGCIGEVLTAHMRSHSTSPRLQLSPTPPVG